MFKTRLLSGILLVIIALITVITGGSLLFGVLLLISLIGMTEFYKVFGIEKKAPGVLGYIFAVGYYALLYFKPQLPGESLNWFMMLFMGYLICQMAVLVFAYPKYNTQQILAGFPIFIRRESFREVFLQYGLSLYAHGDAIRVLTVWEC